MKNVLSGILLLTTFAAHPQLIVNLQLPPSGIVQKCQLWNMLVTNTSKTSLNVSVALMMTDKHSGQQVLSAVSPPIMLPPGNKVINATQLLPIQYVVLSGDYYIDQGQNGFLPPGGFTLCYSFNPPGASSKGPLAVECNTVTIEPLSPPQLVFPEDKATVDTTLNPQFAWLPPAPLNIFTRLYYDLRLVKIEPLQTAADAIQSNLPLLFQQNIASPDLLYPLSAPPLEPGQQYAWQVMAKSNETPVCASETWSFTMKRPLNDSLGSSELPFVRLRKNEESGYSILVGRLKFAYVNETADTVWSVRVSDISSSTLSPVPFPMDSIPLKRGLNLVEMDLRNSPGFTDSHLYLLELTNSRNEIWRLKFEYLKAKNDY